MRPFLCAFFLLASVVVSLTQAQDIAPFPKAHVQNMWVQTVWVDGKHNGFPGIARVGGFHYITFRSAASHQADEKDPAKIIVVRSPAKDLKTWEEVAEFTRVHDCRDPLVFDEHPQVKGVGHNAANIYLAHLRIRHVQP